MLNYILLALGVICAAGGCLGRRAAAKKLAAADAPTKRQKRPKTMFTILLVVGLYLTATSLITVLFGAKAPEALEVSIWAERVSLFGLDLSVTIVYTWIIVLVLILLAVILRLTVIRHMRQTPKGMQNALECAVENIAKYTESKTGKLGENLGAYIFTVAVFLISCAAFELLGVRAPTADITMTFALALITFVLINYYGIKKRGLAGRVKTLASPTPIVFPFRIVSYFAVPVSRACRLFGNMLGGMIVMDLLYLALGNLAVGIPSIIGLYFNVFHPLIQTFIFVTLSLTFIGEAPEE